MTASVGFSVAGLGLSILAFALAGGVIAANKWIRKITNTYWFWLGVSIFYITYCIVICWSKYWTNFGLINFIDPTTKPAESKIISKAFMLNICPFLNFILPMTLIADPSRKAARAFSPFAIMSSIMVLLVGVPMAPGIKFDWVNIFIGTNGAVDLFYFGHTTNLLIALGIMLNTPKLGWKGAISTSSVVIGFYLYVIIIAYTLGVRWQVAGITLNEFKDGNGTFYWFAYVFGENLVGAQATFFILLIILIIASILLCDLCKRGYFAYGDKYSGCWWRWYDYNKTTIKEPWGWFSHQWQLKHPKIRKSIK